MAKFKFTFKVKHDPRSLTRIPTDKEVAEGNLATQRARLARAIKAGAPAVDLLEIRREIDLAEHYSRTTYDT